MMPIDNGITHMLSYRYMPFTTGYWGTQQQERSKRRLAYFRAYHSKDHKPPKAFRLGEFGEQLAQKKLRGSILANKTGYDLLWNGQRIEVKTTQFEDHSRSYKFDIRIQKREGKTDFFLALILDDHKELLHAYLIPDKAITAKVNLSITPGRSKYDSYRLQLKEKYA